MLVLAHTIALASLTAVPAQTDDPTLVTTVVHAETAQGRSRGNDTAAAGTVADTNWSWRMPVTLDRLLADTGRNDHLRSLLARRG